MTPAADKHLLLDPDLLDLIDKMPRHSGHDLRADITDRPGMHTQLLRSLHDHAGLLRLAITTRRTP